MLATWIWGFDQPAPAAWFTAGVWLLMLLTIVELISPRTYGKQ